VRGSAGNVGLGLALLSAATFGTSGAFAASLIDAGWTPGAAVTARIVIAGLVLTVPALIRLRSFRVSRSSLKTIVVYGVVAVAVAQLCYFNAVQHLSVAVALLLEYSGILLVIGWGWLRHGHRPGRLTSTGGATALVGLVLVLDLVGSHHLDVVGILWGLGAAVGLASYFVITAEAHDDVPPIVVAWGGFVVAAAVLGVVEGAGALPLHAARADVTLLDRQVSWVVPVLGMAIIAAVVAFLTVIVAVRLLGAKLASFVGLTEVLFAVAWAWLLVGQRLDGAQVAGGLLVVAGIALVRLDEMRTPTAARPIAPPREVVAADAA
jgi:drug/metabolite transporter (DMT)-like permease